MPGYIDLQHVFGSDTKYLCAQILQNIAKSANGCLNKKTAIVVVPKFTILHMVALTQIP